MYYVKVFLHVVREYTIVVVVCSMRRTLRSIVHQQSVKVYLNMYDGNVQQNPLCSASCITKDLPISPRFSPNTFYRDAIQRPYKHTFFSTAVGSMRRTLCSKLFISRA